MALSEGGGLDLNALYDDARYAMVTGNFNWLTTDLVLTAWIGQPDYDPQDETLADIVARGLGSVVGHSLPITAKSVASDGTVQTNQVLIPAVPIGDSVTWFTLSKRSGTIMLSTLIYFVDDAEVLPFVPNGLDVLVAPDYLQNRGWFRP